MFLYRSGCHLLLFATALVLFVTSITVSSDAYAVPAFARQTGNACNVCHFQHFPKLTPFGRAFKANGMSLSDQELLEADDTSLSIAPNLNATFFMRSKYVNDSSARGQWEVPEEAAILLGGRLAEGIGGLVEWGGPLLSAKASFTKPVGDHIIGATLFTTDGLGAGYGFEVMNTGAVRNHRPFEKSSKPTLGSTGNLEISQAATGVTLFAGDSHYGTADDADWFISGTFYTADSNEAGITDMDSGSNLSTYFRAAYMPNIMGMHYGVGVGVYSGKTTASATQVAVDDFGAIAAGDLFTINTKAWFVDMQAEGEVGGHELGVYFMYAVGDDPTAGANQFNLYGSATPGDEKPKGWGLDMEYSMTPALHLLATVGQNDDGSAGNKKTMGIGLYWQIRQNIALQPMYERYSGTQGQVAGSDVTLTTLTFEAGF